MITCKSVKIDQHLGTALGHETCTSFGLVCFEMQLSEGLWKNKNWVTSSCTLTPHSCVRSFGRTLQHYNFQYTPHKNASPQPKFMTREPKKQFYFRS
jgi:hypothetical protein